MHNRYKIIKTLKEVDDEFVKTGISAELFLIGGSTFILHNMIDRSTRDIDFVNKVDHDALSILATYGINNRAQIFDATFGDYKSDAVDLGVEFSNLNVKLVNKTRMLVSRLFSRKKHEDLIWPIKNNWVNIDRDTFESIFRDVFKYAQYIYMNELKENIYLIEEIYKLKGWDYETSRIKKLCEEAT